MNTYKKSILACLAITSNLYTAQQNQPSQGSIVYQKPYLQSFEDAQALRNAQNILDDCRLYNPKFWNKVQAAQKFQKEKEAAQNRSFMQAVIFHATEKETEECLKDRQFATKKEVALHEAAHAVIAETYFKNLVLIGKISSLDDGQHVGFIQIDKNYPFTKENEDLTIYKFLIIYMAGPAQEMNFKYNTLGLRAEDKLRIIKNTQAFSNDYWRSVIEIQEHFKDFPQATQDQILHNAFCDAERLIKSLQTEIQAVGKHLEQKNSLAGDEIRTIIASVRQHKII